MTEKKQELEKCLKLSRKLRKEMNALTEWLAVTDSELTKRSAVEGMPINLDAEVAWSKVIIYIFFPCKLTYVCLELSRCHSNTSAPQKSCKQYDIYW